MDGVEVRSGEQNRGEKADHKRTEWSEGTRVGERRGH